MALPSLLTTVHTIAQLLVVVAATTATWAIGDERRGSMFNWDLTQTGLFSSDANRGVLPGKIVPQPANGPRFGKLPPHALRFSGDQQQVEVAKPVDPKTTGRVEIDKALNRDAKLVALSAKTGKIAWEQLVDYAAIEHHLYALYSDDILVTVGSRNQPRGKKDQSQVWYDLHAYDANTGKLLWEKSQNNQTAAGGDHGEQDHHPVLVGNRLFVEPFAYNLQTGEPVSDWQWHRGHRGGCGTVSASAGAFFFRDSNAAMFDLADQKHFKITQVSRPGCWINMIPAGGLLLIPEASSGCTCHFPVQASMAFRPVLKGDGRANPESKPGFKPK